MASGEFDGSVNNTPENNNNSMASLHGNAHEAANAPSKLSQVLQDNRSQNVAAGAQPKQARSGRRAGPNATKNENKYSQTEGGSRLTRKKKQKNSGLFQKRKQSATNIGGSEKKEKEEKTEEEKKSEETEENQENTESQGAGQGEQENQEEQSDESAGGAAGAVKLISKAKKIKKVLKLLPVITYISIGFICAAGIAIITIAICMALGVDITGDEKEKSGVEKVAERAMMGSSFYDDEDIIEEYEYSVVDKFSSMYGNSSCTILEEYVPLTHEYIVSKSNDSSNIYSVTDGIVTYVNNRGINLYNNYDYKTKKCMCDNRICDNYNGSEIKIKFEQENISYVVTYSNLASINVSVGDIVKKGDLIGTEGNTGCVSSKRLTFKVVSENGISYNTNDLLKTCVTNLSNNKLCDFQNIKINILDCNNNYIKKVDFYDYIKTKIYQDFNIDNINEEVLKVLSIAETTKILHETNYQIGDNDLIIKDCSYENLEIDSDKISNAINKTINQVLTYRGEFVLPKYSENCSRGENDKNANSIYNELCINEASKTSKTYEEIIKIYYPNYVLTDSYCSDYLAKTNMYKLDNNKTIVEVYDDELVQKYNNILESKINIAKYGSRAAVVEAARFLTLGFKYKIPFVNGGKFFEKGLNKYWSNEGLDSSGFVSWALLNGGAKIEKNQNIQELVSNNTTGKLKIESNFYNYYDKINVGDFAYKDSKIGIIIGKEDGILYVAESDFEKGLIVTEIKSFGQSDSNYKYIYFADDYYMETGSLSSMW